MRKPRAKPKRGERAKGRKTNERLQAYRQEMKGVEGLVKRGHRCVAASSVKDCTKLRFCFRFHKRRGVFSTFLSQFIEKTSFMQPDCKLSVYANAYTYRCIVSIAMEIERSFFCLCAPFRRKTMAFRPNLARPRVRCFSFFAFTSSPFGYKYLSDSVISVKAKRRFAFTRKNIEERCAKSADSIAEDSSTR